MMGAFGVESGSQIVVATLVTLLVTFLVTYIEVVYRQGRKKVPPGPKPWPIVGNFPTLTGDLPHRALQKLAAKYGGLMYLRLGMSPHRLMLAGSVPCIVVSTSAAAKELFQTNDAQFASRPKAFVLHALSDTTEYKFLSGAPYGPYWRQLRKLCHTVLFAPARVATYRSVRAEEIRTMMKVLVDDSKKGDAVNVRSWLHGLTANNMTRMLINKRYFGPGVEMQKEKEEFELMIGRALEYMGTFFINDYLPYLSFITKLQGWPSKFKDLSVLRDRVSARMFEVEKHRQNSKDMKGDDNYVPDFVDILQATPLEDGKPLPDKDIILVLLDMLAAGTDTSATTAEWAMAELILKPDVVKRAQDELDRVVGTDRLVEESDLPNLPYLQAIVKETFRMHPAAPMSLPQESVQETELLGYTLPKHTRLILNIFAIHRDPNVYENPNQFNPQRFVEHPEVNHMSGSDPYQLIPFGAGRRMCPGYNLGNLVASLMLANLLHGFDWSLPEGEHAETFDMSETFGVTVCKKNPLILIANPKSSAILC